MRRTLLRRCAAALVAGASLASPASSQAPATVADSVRIAAVLSDLDTAWHSADADRWVAHYAPDARFINITGALVADTRALRERLDQIFHGVFRGSRHTGTLRHLRFLGPAAAVVDEDIEITAFRALPPGIRPTAPGVLRTRMRHILQRVGSRWLIVASQNTAVTPAP